jgi:DNA-binding ferritin-like protein
MISKARFTHSNVHVRFRETLSTQMLEVAEKIQSVEATTQQTLANLAAQPKIEESNDEDEEEDQKVSGGLKNALDEINARNL